MAETKVELCAQCGKPAHYGGCYLPFDKPKPEAPSTPEEIAIAVEAAGRHVSPVTVRREMAERKLAAASPDQRAIYYREVSPVVEACQWQGAGEDLVPKAPWPPGWDVSIARVVGSLTVPGEFDLVFGTTTVQPGDWIVLRDDGSFHGMPAALFHARFQPAVPIVPADNICGACRAGNHDKCDAPLEPIETENEGGLAFVQLCCCNRR